jgi:hypothetical protein
MAYCKVLDEIIRTERDYVEGLLLIKAVSNIVLSSRLSDPRAERHQ